MKTIQTIIESMTTEAYRFDEQTERKLEAIGIKPTCNIGQYDDCLCEIYVYAEPKNEFSIMTLQNANETRDKKAAEKIEKKMQEQIKKVREIVAILTEAQE